MLTDKTDNAGTRWRDAHIYSKMEGRGMKRARQRGCSEVGVEWPRWRFCSDSLIQGGGSVYGGAVQGAVED